MQLASMNIFCSIFQYFFKKFAVTVRFFQPSYFRFLWDESLERSPYFTLYPNKIPVLILMLMRRSKIKLSYTISIHTWKTFVADFFYDNVFFSLFFGCFTLFFINELVFFEKHQNISESVFLHNTVEHL